MTAVPQSETGKSFVWELFHPRTVISSFKSRGPSLSRTLWIVAVLTVVSIVTIAWETAELQTRFATHEAVFGNSLADILIFGSVDAVFYPVLLFLWYFLFGFRNDKAGVRAATDASYAYSTAVYLVATIVKVSLLRLGVSEQISNWMFVPSATVLLGVSVICYKTALEITWVKSALLNTAALAIIITGVVLAFLGWIVVDAVLTEFPT